MFKETAFFREIKPVTHVARGEHASFQWVVRSMEEYIEELELEVESLSHDTNELTNIKIGYVGYVSVGRNTPNHSRDRLSPISGLYPDPILEKESIDLMANETQPIWVTIEIPMMPNLVCMKGRLSYPGKWMVQQFEMRQPIQVNVYPVTVEKTRLWVTNWYNTSQQNIEYVMGKVRYGAIF